MSENKLDQEFLLIGSPGIGKTFSIRSYYAQDFLIQKTEKKGKISVMYVEARFPIPTQKTDEKLLDAGGGQSDC